MLGPSFRDEAARLMPVLAVALWIGGFKSFYLDVVFQIRHTTRYLAWIAVVMMIVNVGLNLLLLPVMGTMGAAWATIAAFGAGAALSIGVGRGLMRLAPIRVDAFKALLACGVMAGVLVSMSRLTSSGWLIAKVGLGGAAYIAAAWSIDPAGVRAWAAQRLGGRV